MITNGLRVMWDPFGKDTQWTEVSCRGNVYALRSSFKKKGQKLERTNLLLVNLFPPFYPLSDHLKILFFFCVGWNFGEHWRPDFYVEIYQIYS